MRFRYDVKVNGEDFDIEHGFTLTDDFEEALDGGKLKIVLSDRELPLEQYSLVQIKIYEVDTENVQSYEYFLISDEVIQVSKYDNYYEHNLSLIEFTAKHDLYQKSAYQFSKDIYSNTFAKYTYLLGNYSIPLNLGQNIINSESDTSDGYLLRISKGFVVPKPIIKGVYLGDVTIPKVDMGLYQVQGVGANDGYKTGDIYLKVDESSTKHILSSDDFIDNLSVGIHTITIGITVFDYDMTNPKFVDFDYYKFYIDVRNINSDTMYDVIMDIRDLVSKYGGIESKKYFAETRLFSLDSESEAYLKTIDAPQIYIPSATLRQVLIFVLSYVNALPRLSSGFGIDSLTLEFFGKSLGEYVKENLNENYSEQNTNQIGTRSYAELHNILPNDLGQATTYSPYKDGFQTVRATNIQLVDDGFELRLPSDKPMYKPTKFETKLYYEFQDDDGTLIDRGSLILDLTDILINVSEWNLKQISTNFPSAIYDKAFYPDVGLDRFKLENISWQEGITKIKLSDSFGTIFKNTQIESVLKHAIAKYITEEYISTNSSGIASITKVLFTNLNLSDLLWYKDLLFSIEYITNENITIKQDKEDLTQISFYSEIRHNQDENTVSLARASSKVYGDLQRTGNKVNTFTKYHTSLSELYKVGQKDKDGYTITSIKKQYFNDYIEATYSVTKHHNRISQATFIDQTYRWRDNYASELKNRQETYNDYVMLLPHKVGQEPLLENTSTKIVSKLNEFQVDNVPYVFKSLFGILGIQHAITNTKATVGLVRTDGTINEWNDNSEYFNFISVPISSAGYKGGLVFKIGFNDNQVAGDGLVRDEVGNWYNQAVRYTDRNARIKYFDFYILNKRTFLNADGNEETRYPRVIEYANVVNDNVVATQEDLVYFSTGNVIENQNANDSLIINKDPMSNFALNYSLNVMSYYYGLFIIGRDFFIKNQLVSESKFNVTPYLYIYNDGTYYDIFEDIKVKDGYRVSYNLSINTTLVHLTLSGGYVIINIERLLSSDTSWAIGDEFGNLIFASNENIDKIEVVRRHIRPNVSVAGQINSGVKFETDLRVQGGINFGNINKVSLNANIRLRLGFDNYPAIGAIALLRLNGGLTQQKVIGTNLNSNVSLKPRNISSRASSTRSLLRLSGNIIRGYAKQTNLNGNIKAKPNARLLNKVNLISKTKLSVKGEYFIGNSNSVRLNANIRAKFNENLDPTLRTAYPLVGNVTCRRESGQNRIYADITNRDSMRARIMNNGQTITDLDPGQTANVRLGIIISTGLTFNYSVSAQVDGIKLISNNTIGSQLIVYCST